MQHCLTVPELVDEITSHCNKASLANLARTARLFDCALDKLWTNIALQELILCFSSEVVEFSRHYNETSVTLLKHPEPRHWDRFHFYGKRVKTIWLRTRGLDDAFIDLLCLRAPQGGLLPRLHTCSLRTTLLSHLLLLRPFISSILKDLHFRIDAENEPSRDPVSTSFLASLPNFCPLLMRLTIDFSLDEGLPDDLHLGDYLPDFPNFLRSFQNLQELEISDARISHFPVVSSLLQLTSLSLTCWKERDTTHPREPVTHMHRSLRCLHVTSPINSLCILLRYIATCPMEDIRLDIGDDVWIGIDALFLALRDACERYTLRRLEINFDAESVPVTDGDSLSLLLEFPNITELHFPFDAIRVADRHISMLARSWPKLAILNVNYPGCPRSSDIFLTIKSLDSLVRHCPLLRNLSISFDAMKVDFDAESIPADGASNRLVTELDVGNSPISQAPPVANYLSAIFPNLQKIHWKVHSRDVSLWEDVNRIIPTIAAHVQHQEQP